MASEAVNPKEGTTGIEGIVREAKEETRGKDQVDPEKIEKGPGREEVALGTGVLETSRERPVLAMGHRGFPTAQTTTAAGTRMTLQTTSTPRPHRRGGTSRPPGSAEGL